MHNDAQLRDKYYDKLCVTYNICWVLSRRKQLLQFHVIINMALGENTSQAVL